EGQPRPGKTARLAPHRPLEPFLFPSIPAEAVNRKGIEQFVGKNHPLHGRPRRAFPGMEPANPRSERGQRRLLPLPPPDRRFQNPVLEVGEQAGPPPFEPSEDISSQTPI